MSDQNKRNNKEIKLTWVQGPNTSWVLGPNSAANYEKNLLNALWDDLNRRVAEKEIEQQLLGGDFAEANQIISRVKQQSKGQ